MTKRVGFYKLDDLIGLWPSDADFARDIGKNPTHIGQFRLRNNIPSTHWPAIIAAAAKRALDPAIDAKVVEKLRQVTADELLKLQTRLLASADA